MMTKPDHRLHVKIIPFNVSHKEQVLRTIERIRALSEAYSLSELDWKTLRDEGRQ
jgi:hypothetical protein